MRTAFIQALTEQAKKEKRIILLTGDLGFSVFENFEKDFPQRFFNIGIQEQNMVGISAGLSLTGKKVFAYSIIPFITLRCMEHIRNDLCYQDLKVVLVGVGTGFSYGSLGFSHQALEDIGILKTLPNMTILSPADPVEIHALVKECSSYKHPIYMRIGKCIGSITKKKNIKIGEINILEQGKDTAILTHGDIAHEVYAAYQQLVLKGHHPTLVTFPTIKPLNVKATQQLLKEHKNIVIIEEHYAFGGLGDSIFQLNKDNLNKNRFLHCCVSNTFLEKGGDSRFLRKASGLDAASLTKTILKFLKKA